MRIKNFSEFKNTLSESYYSRSGSYYRDYDQKGEGKTSFSRWLRGINTRLGYQIDDIRAERPYSSGPGAVDTFAASRKAQEFFPGVLKALTGATAAVVDFFVPKKKGEKTSDLDLKKDKDSNLDQWERENLNKDKYSTKDAEDFYKSGVLQGRKSFGPNYNPERPIGDDQKLFSNYLQGAMKRYYNRIDDRQSTY